METSKLTLLNHNPAAQLDPQLMRVRDGSNTSTLFLPTQIILTTSVVDLDPGSVPPLQHNILLQLHEGNWSIPGEALARILKQDLFLFPFLGGYFDLPGSGPSMWKWPYKKRLLRRIALLKCISETSVDSWRKSIDNVHLIHKSPSLNIWACCRDRDPDPQHLSTL